MYHVSAQGVDERIINVHYYYYYYYTTEPDFIHGRTPSPLFLFSVDSASVVRRSSASHSEKTQQDTQRACTDAV